jgi:hypothetical protein
MFIDLGDPLSKLVGTEGYRALMTRALHLASAEFPLLGPVRPAISPPGRLLGLPRISQRTTAAEVVAAITATLASLLWLLEEFIGRDLTQRILGEVWPRLFDAGTDQPVRRRLTGSCDSRRDA